MSNQQEAKIDYIRGMSERSFQCGDCFAPEDFESFRKDVLENTGLEASEEDFKLYFDFVDEYIDEFLEQEHNAFDPADD